jgi:hypothetical protein
VTNDLGHRIARFAGDQETLGAYRRGNRLPWIPGATIDVWNRCPRSEIVTGVPVPHVFFIQTLGGGTADDGSIHCPVCRAELAAIRVNAIPKPVSKPVTTEDQTKLPF